ncbi:50S ribosomal protein L5, partial [bacterium]|nr:50S ribosomal protein L5 [candidate division CSSED10-310 bacterium]
MECNLKKKYKEEAIPGLNKEFSYKNVHEVPRLIKVTINIGMGEAIQNHRLLETAVKEIGQITGQKPIVTRARKSIAGFKIRQGMPIGCCVTLRGTRMYEF